MVKSLFIVILEDPPQGYDLAVYRDLIERSGIHVFEVIDTKLFLLSARI